ncbi:MAG TPA: hypothetical protein VMB51_01165 [Solirubrobacteraceae bacterium]|nr:hypothetical protein [Solirubrobacteraceae bacterium]
MPGDLTGVYLKIERAKAHLAELQDSINTGFDPGSYRFSLERDPQTDKHVLTVHDLPEIDPQWSLQAGDVVHNLRAALDHLAWQLVRLDKGTPGEHTQLPIRKSPFNQKGERIPPQLNPAVQNPQILAALEEIQPYYRPNGDNLSTPHLSLLWRIHRLDIIDKHRLLLVVRAVLNVGEMWWGEPLEGGKPDFKGTLEPVAEGAPVAWFDFHGAEPSADFDPHPSLAITMREDEMIELRATPLAKFLDGLSHFVEWDIIDAHFRPLFP